MAPVLFIAILRLMRHHVSHGAMGHYIKCRVQVTDSGHVVMAVTRPVMNPMNAFMFPVMLMGAFMRAGISMVMSTMVIIMPVSVSGLTVPLVIDMTV